MTNNVPNLNPSREGDFFSAIRQVFRTYLSDNICTADLVQVAAISADGSLDLLPVLERVTTTGKTLNNSSDDLICGIKPFYMVGGGCEISIPVSVGDFGLLLSCKLDISNFILTHQTADVASMRQFDRSNGVFLPVDFFSEQKTGITIKRTTEETTDSVIIEASSVTITHSAGEASATISLTDSGVSIQTSADISVNATGNVDVVGADVSVTATGNANVTAASVNLGGNGGAAVARVGDTVNVGGIDGVITAGSAIVKAV